MRPAQKPSNKHLVAKFQYILIPRAFGLATCVQSEHAHKLLKKIRLSSMLKMPAIISIVG